MGCANSKQRLCRKFQTPFSPVRRRSSVLKTGDRRDHHEVGLPSSTPGSFRLDPIDAVLIRPPKDVGPAGNGESGDGEAAVVSAKEEFATGMIEAKTWSNMIGDKIPKTPPRTPTQTPPGEPETINAWEMMEGLEDISPLRPALHVRSLSFQVPPKPFLASFGGDDQPTPRVKKMDEDEGEADETNSPSSPSPPNNLDASLDPVDSDTNSNSNETTIISDFDPDVIATFRKALEELPPANPFHLKAMAAGVDKLSQSRKGFVALTGNNKVAPLGSKKLIVYFTSLRGVRKTYEDCCHVRVILKGLGVRVDERDVSMHSGFKEELKKLSGGVGLPRVFIGKECIGGAEDIRRMNEEGKLEKLVLVCEALDDVGGECGQNGNVCDACGDIRFVPCVTCSGSCKIYYEGDFEDGEEEEEDAAVAPDEGECEYGFRRCPDCNENGLIRCPICCY